MSDPMPRRLLLRGGAAIAASAVLAAPGLSPDKAAAAITVTIRWNASTKKWGRRPANAPFGVIFLSTNDPKAVAPADRYLKAGDLWRRHPDAAAA